MSAIERNAAVIEHLRTGDAVFAAERMKEACVALVAAIDATPQADRRVSADVVHGFLASTSETAAEFLAAALPAIEYGAEVALAALPRCVRHLAGAGALVRQETEWNRLAAVPVLGRLVWALAAFSLHCDTLDPVVDASRARVRVAFTNDEMAPVITMSDLRYPPALEGNAGRSYSDYGDWLRELPLVRERYPLFGAELDDVFAEGDLLLALLTGQYRNRVYSHGLSRRCTGRFRTRVSDLAQRTALESLFTVGQGDLRARLEAAYAEPCP